MIQIPWLKHPLTEQQVRDHFMRILDDDREDAPWMVMGDLQFWSASGFAHSLRNYARELGLPWYVASMLPILYSWSGVAHKKQLAPDVFVAFVPVHPRQSYDVDAEGMFPPFVLEVVSPSSVDRDQMEKREAYEMLGAREYALFTPRTDAPSLLEGYRRAPEGGFAPWPLDEHGRLWSEVLGLYLVVNGMVLQAITADGILLLTPDQADEARQRAEESQRRAEAEVQRLREEIARLRGQDQDLGRPSP